MNEKFFAKQIGITLIALVVTIVVLLILAGVSISMLSGENGIIRQAQKAKRDSTHGEVKEAVIIKYGEYQIELKITQNTLTFIEYLEDKEYIDSDGIIDVKKFTGRQLSLGNGNEESDVYIIEELENKYILNYYEEDPSEENLTLWEVAKKGGNKQDGETLCSGCREFWELYEGVCEGCGQLEEDCTCCPYCGEFDCTGECIRCEYCGSLEGCDCCPDCGAPNYNCETCEQCGRCIEVCNGECEPCEYCGDYTCEGDCYCPNCDSWDGCQCEEEEEDLCPDCGNYWEDCTCNDDGASE